MYFNKNDASVLNLKESTLKKKEKINKQDNTNTNTTNYTGVKQHILKHPTHQMDFANPTILNTPDEFTSKKFHLTNKKIS